METQPDAPDVTIAIVTRDRKHELRNALATALVQEGSIEVVVIDDGSQDGTAAMVREEFPKVRLVRFDEPAGLAARRNDATEAARADVIVQIDDDAVFSSNDIVRDTLRDLDHPRVGVVAIPYVDVGTSLDELHRVPDREHRWATSVFRGTAFALRRDAVIRVGGWSGPIFHQGEEWDLSLRLLDTGYVIRLGTASSPILHHASPHRDLHKMDVYGRRNELLISWMYFPAPWNLLYAVGYALKGVVLGFRVGRPTAMIEGIVAGVRDCFATPRRPIRRDAFRFDRRARARGPVPLPAAELILGPFPGPTQGRAAWPWPLRSLHEPLRAIRTRVVRRAGRPIRCEVCGEVLFRGCAFIWGGRLTVLGAENALVRADWDKMNRLTFRHVESNHCGRTWAR